ncbi:hypothetical protein [Aeoliella sp. SH292]|uniref:hypothetical protein n=1 Tax=Aeoliella sp. SH292 TaxID=3454464 RepID=UPI003F979833
MALYQLHSFDFQAFQNGCAGKLPLAEAVAQQVMSWRRSNMKCLAWLPAGETELIAAIASLLASDTWYPSGADDERRGDIDRLVAALFDKPATKIIKAKCLGDGADADVVDFARGFLLLSKKGVRRDPDFQVDRTSELQAVGHRPYRNPAWDAQLLAEEVNPFLTDERPPTADYSVHDPDQTKHLAQELEAFDVTRVPDASQRDEFETNFRQPILQAAKKKLALYVYLDY